MWTLIIFLIVITLVFATLRAVTDVPYFVSGALPDPDSFERRYVANPWLAYVHIVPGILYLLGAPLQLSRRIRERHYTFHRRFGRVVLTLGLVSGVFALGFGIPFSYGGAWQSLATAVFGSWFLVALVLAYRAIRFKRVRMHRRWMIRAFAVGLGVGTIRIWIGLLAGTGILPSIDAFAPAFWLGFTMHVLAGEAWLWWRPNETGLPRRAAGGPNAAGTTPSSSEGQGKP